MLSEAELAMRKRAESAIERLHEELEIKVQERMAELAGLNDELKRRDSLLRGVAEAARRLISIDDFDTAVNDALVAIAETSGIDRVYIFEHHVDPQTGQETATCPYEWTAPGVPKSREVPGRFPMAYDGFGNWLDELKAGRFVQGLARDLDEPARQIQSIDHALSLLAVPIMIDGRYWGVIGFDECTQERLWMPAEVSVLETAAAILAGAIQRRCTAEALQAAQAERERAAQERAKELSRMNEAMHAEVAERRRAEQVSRGQTEALVKTLSILAAEPVLDNFLGYVLQAISEQLGDRSGGIYLYNEVYDTTILHINYESGQIQRGALISHPGASTPNPPKQWDAEYMPLLRQNHVLIHDERHFAESPAYAPYRKNNAERGIKTILVVPLLFGETFLGNITLRSTQRRDYKPEEVELARVLAYQATLAIQLTRLAEQAQQSAVLQERNRIAREIHDTLAQVLTGIVVQLQATEDVYATDPNDRQAHIATARLLAKTGLTEARRSLRALRPQALEDTNLGSALPNLIEQMSTGTGLAAICHVRGTPYLLPPDVESNLLRISQEAFTNTLKHAHASEVEIELVYQPGQVRLLVQDNGQGFNPDLPPTEGYGLLGMRERAQNIGAELTITSRPGYGTEVAIAVPILSPGAQRSSS